MNVYVVVVLFLNLTFEERVAANDCSINSDKGRGSSFLKTIRNSLFKLFKEEAHCDNICVKI